MYRMCHLSQTGEMLQANLIIMQQITKSDCFFKWKIEQSLV